MVISNQEFMRFFHYPLGCCLTGPWRVYSLNITCNIHVCQSLINGFFYGQPWKWHLWVVLTWEVHKPFSAKMTDMLKARWLHYQFPLCGARGAHKRFQSFGPWTYWNLLWAQINNSRAAQSQPICIQRLHAPMKQGGPSRKFHAILDNFSRLKMMNIRQAKYNTPFRYDAYLWKLIWKIQVWLHIPAWFMIRLDLLMIFIISPKCCFLSSVSNQCYDLCRHKSNTYTSESNLMALENRRNEFVKCQRLSDTRHGKHRRLFAHNLKN